MNSFSIFLFSEDGTFTISLSCYLLVAAEISILINSFGYSEDELFLNY